MIEENKRKVIAEIIVAEREQTAKFDEELTNQETCLKEMENKLRELSESTSGEGTIKSEVITQANKNIEALEHLFEKHKPLSANIRESLNLLIEANNTTNGKITRYEKAKKEGNVYIKSRNE